MKILYLSHKIPYPPNRGGKIRPFYVISHLAKQHSVVVACLLESKNEFEYIEPLQKICAGVHAVLLPTIKSILKTPWYLFTNKPFTLPYFYSPKLKKIIDDLLKKDSFDLILVHSSSMAQYVIDYTGILKIMDFVDVDSDKWRQYSTYTKFPFSLIYHLEWLRLKKYEVAIAKSFNHCILISKFEEEILKEYINNDQIPISTISNGVDFEYFKPITQPYEPNTLILTGKMNYLPNVDGALYFYYNILPLIREKIPDVKFYIVGVNPTKAIQKLGKDKNVIVTGYVKDIRPYLQKASVCIVPLRIARGVQNKVLEAMAMALPVVTTSKSFEGINATANQDLFVEDNPHEFAKRTIELLKNAELRNKVSLNARKKVIETHNWSVNVQQFDEIIKKHTH